MRKPVLVIENMPEDCPNSVADLLNVFPADNWLLVKTDGSVSRLDRWDDRLAPPASLKSPTSTLHFFRMLAKWLPASTTIIRVRRPVYPLHPAMYGEIQEGFPEYRYDYVLSTAVECGLKDYFAERFNLAFLNQIRSDQVPIMPAGYFNGMALPRSGRHWFSLELRRYYLETHFETLFSSPRSVAVNAVPGCNYRCMKCQYHSPRLQTPHHYGAPMGLDTLGGILEKCDSYKDLVSIAPTISGEPLVHPQIDKIVRMIKDKGYGCGFATNASLLTEDMGKRLLDAGADSLAFSVDAVSQETYQRLQGANLEKIERNILSFQEETQRRRGTFHGTMIFVVSEENQHEIEAYRERWLRRGFSVLFSAQHDILANNRPFFAHSRWSPPRRMPCPLLWHGLYLADTGRILTCGSMARGAGLKESILDTPPEVLWRSESFQELRRQQLLGETPGYCKEFSCWTGLMGTWVHEQGRLQYHTQGSWLEQPVAPQKHDSNLGLGALKRIVHTIRSRAHRL